MLSKIFIIDNCARLHAQQFGLYCSNFSQNVESAMNQTGIVAKLLDGEYNGLYITNTAGGIEVLHNQGPFSNTTGQSTDYFEVLKPETIPGFEQCISATGKINFDHLLVLTASMETTEHIISDDRDISKHSLSSGCNMLIYSFWDLLIATIHHSKISLSQCLLTTSSLKKEGSSRFPTEFWEKDKKISSSCIFCGEDIIKYVREFEKKN
jgi:hypothetical protein